MSTWLSATATAAAAWCPTGPPDRPTCWIRPWFAVSVMRTDKLIYIAESW